jgi:inward rectifier potassium channel
MVTIRRTRHAISGREFVTYGLQRLLLQDLYHLLMTISWPRLFLSLAGFFAVLNLLFAGLYEFEPNGVANVNPPGYWGLFFFSIETSGTLGYGDMHPQAVFTHILASVETFFGVSSFALMTGLMYARFSRPTARFLFARYAVIQPVDGRLTLVIRSANARANIVMEANAHLRLLRDERTLEGQSIRRLYDLRLLRDQHPIFLFGWNLMHVIDPNSPLAGASTASLEAMNALLLLTISGTDETTGQILMTRHAYRPSQLRWNYAFVDILTTDANDVDHFDYRHFHEVRPLDEPIPAGQ